MERERAREKRRQRDGKIQRGRERRDGERKRERKRGGRERESLLPDRVEQTLDCLQSRIGCITSNCRLLQLVIFLLMLSKCLPTFMLSL